MTRWSWRYSLLAVGFCMCAFHLQASPITYTITTALSGALGSTPFTNAASSITLLADTSTITNGPNPYSAFLINPGMAILSIKGFPNTTFSDPIVIGSTYHSNLNGEDAVLFVDETTGVGIIAATGSIFYGYNLATSLAPGLTGGGAANGGGAGNSVPTALGNLIFSMQQQTSSATFTATSTPEPGTLVLMVLATLGMAGTYWRRAKTRE